MPLLHLSTQARVFLEPFLAQVCMSLAHLFAQSADLFPDIRKPFAQFADVELHLAQI
jgi:hypothetical protein